MRQSAVRAGVVAFALVAGPGGAPARAQQADLTSPIRRIQRARSERPAPERRSAPPEFRSLDGSGNHLERPETGAAFTPLLRFFAPAYEDGVASMAGASRPGPRSVSNQVSAEPRAIPDPLRASDYLWQWGQFLDHDLDLTDVTDPPELAPVPVPPGDPWFDPQGTGQAEIPFNRSFYDPGTGTAAGNPRQQMNEITAWIDASNVYGSDAVRAAALREPDGSGRLRTSEGGLLPFNDEGLPNAGGPGPELFLAGDVRANEQVGLTALHTLFVREHNRRVAQLAAEHPRWDGDRLYEEARRLVGAEVQVITYREFLPALLGKDALQPYAGYDRAVDAGIRTEFATAAYRFGHSALSPRILRLDARGRPIPAGPLALRDAFFAPERVTEEGGIEPLLRGLAAQVSRRVDVFVVDDVRNFLFGAPGAGGFDLASLNIQRGRDHGLPAYNDAREEAGLPRAADFADISSDPEVQARLAEAYGDPDAVDLWVGGLAEDPLPRSHLGPLFQRILVAQFEALRDGDRFWYRRSLDARALRDVESTRLSDVIRRNTPIRREIPDDVFHVGSGRATKAGG